MTLHEVQQYIVTNIRSAHESDDLMMMFYQELYSLYVKCMLPSEYYYRLAHEIFDYVNRDKDV